MQRVTLRSLKEAASRVTPSYMQRVRLNYGELVADTWSYTDTQQLLPGLGFRGRNRQVILLSKDGLPPVDGTPLASEAERHLKCTPRWLRFGFGVGALPCHSIHPAA